MRMPPATPSHPHFTTLFAAVLAALLAASAAHAQVWNEIGDAGDLISTAQATAGAGPLYVINGNLDSPTDVDIYCVDMPSVPAPGLPLVQLQCVVITGPDVWLFDANGNGVFTNMVCSAGSKTLVAPSTSLPAGRYYVAVSYDGYEPQSAGGPIWLPGILGQRAPDGPGAAGALTGWAGTPTVQPNNPYVIQLGMMTYCDAPTPTLRPTWGSLKVHYSN